jgi:T5SS/PEP-CTERM-associated repeat protein
MVIVTGPMTFVESHDTFVGREGIGTLVVEEAAWLDTIGSVSIGTAAGADGGAFLSTGGRWTTSGTEFLLGEAGDATMIISGDAQLWSDTGGGVFVAADPGSTASLTITGAGSEWIEQSATLFVALSGQGDVTLADGATLEFPLTVCSNGCEVRGVGTLVGNVTNVGAFRPGDVAGAPASGVLTVDGGDYSQRDVAEGTGDEDSGSLFIDLFGPAPDLEHDVLALLGNANLGGGLILAFTGGFDPPVGSEVAIITTAGLLFDTFDVAYTTGLPPDKLAVVQYQTGPGGGVRIVILALGDDIIFGDPDTSLVEGAAADAVLADLDGDAEHLPDLAVALRDFDQVAILINQGTDPPSFVQTQLVTVGAGPSGIAAGTLDADGSFDLAVTNALDGSVTLLLNDGSGTFTTSTIPGVGAEPLAIAAGDFTENGITDLAVALGGSGTVLILENDGGAMFAQGASIVVESRPVALDPADLDQDKDTDLVAANSMSASLSFVQLEGGVAVQVTDVPVGAGPAALVTGDLDLDGFVDVVNINGADGTASIILGNGDGTYVPSVDLPVGESPSSLTALDVDRDGDVDVAVVIDDPVDGRVIRVLRNDLIHDGTMEDQLAFVLDSTVLGLGQDPILVLSDDIDGDGDEDLVTVNESVAGPGPGGVASIAVLLNLACPEDVDEDGTVGFGDLLAILAAWGPCLECPADLDGDGTVGFPDLLAVLSAWGPCA